MQWSNDYALITSIIFFVFYIGYFNFKYKVFWLKSVITLILYSFISWLFILSFITAGHPLEIIKYNFFDVAKDQWWYFAPYEEINKVFGIQEVYKIFLKEIWFPLATLIFTLLKAIQKRRVEYYLLFMLGLISLCGGIIASLGGHVSLYYFQSFIFWAATTSILALLRVTQIFIMNLLIKKEIIFSISKNTFYLFVFLFKCLWR